MRCLACMAAVLPARLRVALGATGLLPASLSQSGDEDPCYITLPSRPKPPASSQEGEADSIRGNLLLPLPSSGSSQRLLLLSAPAPNPGNSPSR